MKFSELKHLCRGDRIEVEFEVTVGPIRGTVEAVEGAQEIAARCASATHGAGNDVLLNIYDLGTFQEGVLVTAVMDEVIYAKGKRIWLAVAADVERLCLLDQIVEAVEDPQMTPTNQSDLTVIPDQVVQSAQVVAPAQKKPRKTPEERGCREVCIVLPLPLLAMLDAVRDAQRRSRSAIITELLEVYLRGSNVSSPGVTTSALGQPKKRRKKRSKQQQEEQSQAERTAWAIGYIKTKRQNHHKKFSSDSGPVEDDQPVAEPTTTDQTTQSESNNQNNAETQ